jgi:Fe-S-cluster containining protein
MSIKRKVNAVNKLFKELEKEVQTLKEGTGMMCVAGCGKCCFKSDVEATILEFLPLAYELFVRGEAETWHEKIRTAPDRQVCWALQALATDQRSGKCTQYTNRGLICRLFAFSATLDKYGQKRLSTCNIIKTELPEAYQKADAWVKEGRPVAVMRHYYFRLSGIDHRLSEKFYPINVAIRLAIEEVLAYYTYRRPRKAS